MSSARRMQIFSIHFVYKMLSAGGNDFSSFWSAVEKTFPKSKVEAEVEAYCLCFAFWVGSFHIVLKKISEVNNTAHV